MLLMFIVISTVIFMNICELLIFGFVPVLLLVRIEVWAHLKSMFLGILTYGNFQMDLLFLGITYMSLSYLKLYG